MHNTGNPLPSKDILDLYDNSETIDNFVNSQQDEVPDRFGTKRLTLAGLIKRSMALRNEISDFSGALTFRPEWSDVPMNVSVGVGGEGGALNLQAEALGNRSEINKVTSREALRRSYAEAGYPMVAGSFELGGTVNSATDVLLYEANGIAYKWDGAIPAGGKVVPPGSTPTPQGAGGWNSAGEASLRFDLAAVGGALLIDGGAVYPYKKLLNFSTGGTVANNREAVKYTDGFWYVWGGAFPKTIGASTPDTDTTWKCVGLLSGYAVNDAQNFGFVSGMANALPSFNAMMRSPFFKLTYPVKSTINVADKMALRSFVDIDFNGSTIDWRGVILDGSNKANGMNVDVLHTEDYGGGTLGSYENIFVSNLRLLGNDVGVGINMRNVKRFGIHNVYIEKTQRNGINVSNSQFGTVRDFSLNNCCPRSDLGFTESDLEGWGDGFAIWYGSKNIDVKNGVIEVRDTTRGGRGGFVVDGYAPPGKTVTREITADNINVYGYDRPVHTELCGIVTISNSTFEYTSADKHPFIQSACVVWNPLEVTTFINCKFLTDRSFLKTAGIKAKFIRCTANKNNNTAPMFISGPEEAGSVEFESCDLSQAGGSWGLHNSNFLFDKCNLTSDTAGILLDFGGYSQAHNLIMLNTRLAGSHISANNAMAGSVIKLSGCDLTHDVHTGPLAHLHVDSCNIQGTVTALTVLRYNGQLPKTLAYLQNVDQQYNGMWLGTGKPVGARPDGSGNWLRGDKIINLDATESNPYLWQCVTAGSPGRWSVAGTLGVGI